MSDKSSTIDALEQLSLEFFGSVASVLSGKRDVWALYEIDSSISLSVSKTLLLPFEHVSVWLFLQNSVQQIEEECSESVLEMENIVRDVYF